MPTKATGIDQYLNYFYEGIYESVVNTGKVFTLETAISKKDKIGMLLYQIDYIFNAAQLLASLSAANANIILAMSHFYNGSVAYTSPAYSGIIDYQEIGVVATMVGLTGILNYKISQQFPAPVIAHPASLYFHIKGLNCAAIAQCKIRLGYLYIDLSDQEYQEML